MNRKRWIIVAVIILVAGLAYAGISIGRRLSAARAASETPAAETAVVQRSTLRVTVGANGSLAPRAEISLAFPSGGRVAEVLVEEGQAVEAGQPLVRLETDDLTLQVTQAELTLRQAEIELENLQEPPDEAEVGVARATVSDAAAAYETARMNQTVTEHSVSVGDEVRQARLNRDQAYSRYQALVGRFGESDDRVAPAHDAYLNALGQYNRAVENAELQTTTARNDVTQAYHTLQKAQDDLDELLAGASERDVESAQLQIAQSRASLEQAQLRLEQATLTAPVAGTVTALNVEPGEMAGAAQAAVVLSDLSALEVDINLDETDVAQVAVGQEALVTLDAFPGAELKGEVTYIAPVAQTQSGVVLYPVTVRLAPVELPVRAGMTADVDIVTVSQENVLIVPLRAIRSVEGQSFVLRQVANGQSGTPGGSSRPGGSGSDLGQQLAMAGFEPVTVTLGSMTETEVEITSGLAEGDVVSVVATPAQGTGGERPGPMGMFGGGD